MMQPQPHELKINQNIPKNPSSRRIRADFSSPRFTCIVVRIAGSPLLLLFSSPNPAGECALEKGPVQMQARNTRRRALVKVATKLSRTQKAGVVLTVN